MKQLLVGIAAVLVAASAFAQGTVNFANKSGTAIDAPVSYAGGGRVVGTGANGVLGQLNAAAPGGTLVAVGAPVPFREGTGAGYITAGGTVDVGVPFGASASVKLVAWYASQGASYAEAVAKGQGGFGESLPITVAATGGGGTPPALPAPLTGLAGFEVSAIVPEPSIAALGLLGAGLLLIRRKK